MLANGRVVVDVGDDDDDDDDDDGRGGKRA